MPNPCPMSALECPGYSSASWLSKRPIAGSLSSETQLEKRHSEKPCGAARPGSDARERVNTKRKSLNKLKVKTYASPIPVPGAVAIEWIRLLQERDLPKGSGSSSFPWFPTPVCSTFKHSSAFTPWCACYSVLKPQCSSHKPYSRRTKLPAALHHVPASPVCRACSSHHHPGSSHLHWAHLAPPNMDRAHLDPS